MNFITREALDVGYPIRAMYGCALGLSGAEMHVYAFVRAFSSNEDGCFYGSQLYMTKVTGLSAPTVSKALKSLVKSGFLLKDVHFCYDAVRPAYRVNDEKECRLVKEYLEREKRAHALAREKRVAHLLAKC